MRLWHIDLIPYLPKKQLQAQWRELNSIFKKQDKHILINYIYDYPKKYLWRYTAKVLNEMKSRNIKIKTWDNYDKYFKDEYVVFDDLKYQEHDLTYLNICYFNLLEKYIRGQKDFSDELYKELTKFYKEQMKSFKDDKKVKGEISIWQSI